MAEYLRECGFAVFEASNGMMEEMFGVDTASRELSQTCWFIEIGKALESVLSG
jgi:hypothetical protein